MSNWQPNDPRQQQPQGAPQYQQQYPPQGYGPPPSYGPPSPQPPRRSRRGLAFLGCGGLGALVILIAALASHSSSSSPPAALPTLPTVAVQTAASPAAAQTLTYAVTGSPADVTYGPTGTNVSGTVPLRASGPLGSPLYYHITAQLQGGGTVSCQILIDGKVISQATASGGYNIAMCEISKNPLTGAWQDTNGNS